MSATFLRFAISLAAILMAIIHLIWPDFKIDAITLSLFVIAIFPWLAPIFKSIELPGGFKIELQEVRKAANAVISASTPPLAPISLVGTSTSRSSAKGAISVRTKLRKARRPKAIVENRRAIANLLSLSGSDPNLALVGFRIEIEKRLRELARRNNIDDSKPLSAVLKELQIKEAVPPMSLSALNELITLGNKAAHGQSVDPAIGSWIFEQGASVLDVLDKFMAQQAENG